VCVCVNINPSKMHYFQINSNFQGSISHVHLVKINVLETKTEIKTFDLKIENQLIKIMHSKYEKLNYN